MRVSMILPEQQPMRVSRESELRALMLEPRSNDPLQDDATISIKRLDGAAGKDVMNLSGNGK
ncbi:MAG: hypothetical protein LBU32_16045 [Clostridiales bacterium]|nr:hypothetical protein [Clostridiales bacterium]